MADYCTSDQVKYFAGIKSETANANRDQAIADEIPRVTAAINRACGTFFDQRSLTLYLKPAPRSQFLELPAPIISIASVTETGNLLNPTGDYVIEYPARIKRVVGFWDTIEYQAPGGVSLHYPLCVVGVFGFAATPGDVSQLAVELVALRCGLKKRSFVDGDKMQQVVTLTKEPDYIASLLAGRRLYGWEMTGQRCEPPAAPGLT